MKKRTVINQFSGVRAKDGDGVRLTRVIGSPQINMLDPFLLLDCFESDDSQDYIGGFPTHPHRGFETVTYLLNGRMRHQDSAGHSGVIESGGVQWMTAGKGILHSEMPEQEEGLMHGYQLWVNLPASAKMMKPAYQEYSAKFTPVEKREGGIQVRVIAGQTDLGTVGPVKNALTHPVYMDVKLPQERAFEQALPPMHTAFIYVIEGAVSIIGEQGQSSESNQVEEQRLAVLSYGERLSVKSTANARFLLIAGKPLNEPVVRGGPFVMNTKEEVMQAFTDFQTGNLR